MATDHVPPDLLFLGTSGGIPVPAFFCRCAVCEEARQAPDGARTRASLAVVGAETTVIDAPPEFELQLERQGLRRVDRIFITHWHYDHIGGLGSLGEIRSCARSEPVHVYLPAEVACHFDEELAYLGESVRVHPVRVGDQIVLPDAMWEVVKTTHTARSVGFVVHAARTFAYLVGVVPPAPTVERLRGVDLLIQEATLDELDEDWTDFALEPAVAFWRETGAPECLLTHYSAHRWLRGRLTAGMGAAERRAYEERNPGLRFARDGLRVRL